MINFSRLQQRFLLDDLRNISEKNLETVMNYFLRNFTTSNYKSVEDYSKKITSENMVYDGDAVCEEDSF